MIDEALFKDPNSSIDHLNGPWGNSAVLVFYSRISFKISKILSRFDFKVCFEPVNKVKFSLLKNLVLRRTDRHLFYSLLFLWFSLYWSNNKTTKMQDWWPPLSNEEIYKSSIASHCWSIIIVLTLLKQASFCSLFPLPVWILMN